MGPVFSVSSFSFLSYRGILLDYKYIKVFIHLFEDGTYLLDMLSLDAQALTSIDGSNLILHLSLPEHIILDFLFIKLLHLFS